LSKAIHSSHVTRKIWRIKCLHVSEEFFVPVNMVDPPGGPYETTCVLQKGGRLQRTHTAQSNVQNSIP